jgi:hypothetical protein
MTALYILGTVLSFIKTPRSVIAFALSVWITTSCVTFAIKQNPKNIERRYPGYRDVQFIQETIQTHSGKSGTPPGNLQIYWPESPELIWFYLHNNSYYSHSQTAGVVFGKETIQEGLRRAARVKPFEVARIMAIKTPLSKGDRERLTFLNAAKDEPAPTKDDLIRLAKDPKLDWIVLSFGLDGLYSTTNQSVYIYDCSRIRQQ